MGHFQAAFASVLEAYGTMFQMVTYDAGALSEANASAGNDVAARTVDARGRRRHTLKSPGSYRRRATSQGPGAGGWRGRRRLAVAAACPEVQPSHCSTPRAERPNLGRCLTDHPWDHPPPFV